jgi:D-inositol-3-phosphate glycosyltransferase
MGNEQFDGKIAIMDYVGSKAGMDYYDTQLLDALAKLNYTTILFSNFKSATSERIIIRKKFSLQTPSFFLLKIADYCLGFFRAALEYKFKHKGKIVLLHFFEATPKDYFTVRLLYWFGFKIILIVHDVSAFGNKEIESIRNKIFDLSSSIVVQNEFSKQELINYLSAENKNKLTLSRHGNFIGLVNESVSTKTARQKLNFSDSKKYILFFGQIKKVKGLEVLIKAMPLIDSNTCLVIAGKTWKDDFSYYQKLISDLQIEQRTLKNIKFISDVERELYLKACDVLVLPYHKIYQSGVLLMGMSYRLAVVASNLESNMEVIQENKNGLLFESGNSTDLAKKINVLFKNENLLQEIKTAAYATMIEKYNWENIATDYNKIIKTIS